jgi:hypothetical protein
MPNPSDEGQAPIPSDPFSLLLNVIKVLAIEKQCGAERRQSITSKVHKENEET